MLLFFSLIDDIITAARVVDAARKFVTNEEFTEQADRRENDYSRCDEKQDEIDARGHFFPLVVDRRYTL